MSEYSISPNSFFTDFNNEVSYDIIYANIRSLRKNFNNFILELSQIDKKISIIVLCETWISSDEVELFNIQGYNAYHCSNDTYRAGGVVCFVDNELNVTNLDVKLLTADVLFLKIQFKNMFINLVCIYRLHRFSERDFTDELYSRLISLANYTVLIGDINIDVMDDSLNTQNYLTMLSGLGFSQIVKCPTRITTQTKSCLDHIFIRHKDLTRFHSTIFDIPLTDHCLLGLKIFPSTVNHNQIKLNHCHYMKSQCIINYSLVKQKLQNLDFMDIFGTHDVNIAFNKFHDILCGIINSSMKNVDNNSKLSKAKTISPWINANILSKLHRKKLLFKTVKKRPYDRNFNEYFSRFSRNLTIEVNEVKTAFYAKQIADCNGDSARQWKIINSLTGASRNKGIDRVQLDNGDIITDPCLVAREVNKHFIAVQSAPDRSQGRLNLNHRLASFFVEPTTGFEVLEVIKGLKNKKSSGFDSINTHLTKEIAEVIAPILVHIINLSFCSGLFPERLKGSLVIPILKKGSSIKLDNLRPISLLSVFSKIFEKIIKSRLVKYLNLINFFSPNQYGFRKGKSTEDALVNVTDLIYNSLNSSSKSTGLFIDFKKAFDLVNHDILLLKMEAAGVRGVALSWFRSFLTGREQRVRVGSSLSEPLPISAGVPQGSVISATLFLIFINDMLELDFKGKPSAFADDVALFYSHKNIETLTNYVSDDLKLLQDWCFLNQMSINVNKTKYVNFDFRTFDLAFNLKYHTKDCLTNNCNCDVISQVPKFKYLGVTLDEKLKWEAHIKDILSKLKSAVRKFYFLKNICTPALLRSLYFSLIDSRLQYGLVCWGGTYKYLIDKLRIVQNHFLRIMLSKRKRDSSFPLFVEVRIMPIQQLYVFKVLRLFFLRSGNTGTTDLLHETRSIKRRVFRVHKVNKSSFKHSFVYSGPTLFNKLPQNIKEINNIKHFCVKVKSFLLNYENLAFSKR